MEKYPEIRFVISVEFTYHRVPDVIDDTVFHFSKYNYGMCENVDDAKKKRNEVLTVLERSGYKIITDIKDGYNSYTASVLCRSKGTECKVIIKDISVSPIEYIEKTAQTCVKDGAEFVKWEFGE